MVDRRMLVLYNFIQLAIAYTVKLDLLLCSTHFLTLPFALTTEKIRIEESGFLVLWHSMLMQIQDGVMLTLKLS